MNSEEQFEQLKKLLALKRHEQPPPGYFDRLPRQIISAIEVEQSRPEPWMLRIWSTLQRKPAFAGVFGVAMCVLVIGGIIFANQTNQTSGSKGSNVAARNANANVAVSPNAAFPTPSNQLADADVSSTNPVASNQGLDVFFNGSLVSSGAFPNVRPAQPVNVPVRPR